MLTCNRSQTESNFCFEYDWFPYGHFVHPLCCQSYSKMNRLCSILYRADLCSAHPGNILTRETGIAIIAKNITVIIFCQHSTVLFQ